MSLLQTIYWEAVYTDGTVFSEANGGKYGDIDRANLEAFRLRDGQGPIVELGTDTERTGWNLVYRRRTSMTPGKKNIVVYLLGWVPQGPIIAVDSDAMQIYQAQQFMEGDPIFYPPVQHPHEGERWPISNSAKIVNPAFERTD